MRGACSIDHRSRPHESVRTTLKSKRCDCPKKRAITSNQLALTFEGSAAIYDDIGSTILPWSYDPTKYLCVWYVCTMRSHISLLTLVPLNRAALYQRLVVVVVLTLTRIIKPVVTGQAPVTLELRNTPGKHTQPKVVHAYITADAIHASTRNI